MDLISVLAEIQNGDNFLIYTYMDSYSQWTITNT